MRSNADIARNRTRAKRLTTWFRLWLHWLVFACGVWMTTGWRGHPRQLDSAARAAQNLVLIRAGEGRRGSAPIMRHRHGRRGAYTLRKLAGGALRRATRGRDHASRLFAILTLLRDLDAHAARLLRRLRNGLTRLRVIDPSPGPAPVHPRAAFSAIARADTS